MTRWPACASMENSEKSKCFRIFVLVPPGPGVSTCIHRWIKVDTKSDFFVMAISNVISKVMNTCIYEKLSSEAALSNHILIIPPK